MSQDEPTSRNASRNHPRGLVVGIGASAGGLDALRAFFSAMPAGTGISFVVVQHQSPSKQSMLAELLGKCTSMPVNEADDGQFLKPNCVFTVPPGKIAKVSSSRLRIGAFDQPGQRRTPINLFMQSLASCHGARAVGIVLSGAGSDGTVGLRAIGEAGGLTLAQEPKSARFDTMPRSAIASGVVDHQLEPSQMPDEIVDYLEYLEEITEASDGDRLRDQLAGSVDEIATLVQAETEHDFSNYKASTLVRRIQRRMQVLHVRDVDDYIDKLRAEPDESRALFKELLIGVTTFFRDTASFESLDEHVLAELFDRAEDKVRIWVPGCANGQEAYSLAMLARQHCDKLDDPPEFQIFATDIDEAALQHARQGVYSQKVIESVPPELRSRYFVREGSRYRVVPELREVILFSLHNLISDPPFTQLDLLSCRNLLIYFGTRLQKKLIPHFHYALRDDGFLFLGNSETLTSHSELFRSVDVKHRIWKRRPATLSTPAGAPLRTRAWSPSMSRSRRSTTPDVHQEMQRALLDRYSPQSAVVNSEGRILCVSDNIERYLKIAGGVFQNNVVKMARTGLRVGIRSALNKAKRTGEKVIHRDVSIKLDDGVQPIELVVDPLLDEQTSAELYMLVFREVTSPMESQRVEFAASSEEAESLIEHLERELSSTRNDLEETVQELEASNEELKSSNEELLSMNEELQSANEELEVSKEEVEAANDALAKANADLENLLTSTQIATLFLDDEYQVQRFTPAVSSIYNLLDKDLGRPLAHITHRAESMPALPSAEQLRQADRFIEDEVQTDDGCWYIRRVLPYHTHSGTDEGMVVTFLDVTALKEAQQSAAQLAAIVRSSSDAIIGKTLDGIITSWNHGAEDIYGHSALDAVGQHISMLVPDQELDELERIMQQVRSGQTVGPFEATRQDSEGNEFSVWLTVSPVRDTEGNVISAAAIGRDISDRKRIEEQLRSRTRELEEARDRADAANQAKSEFLANMSHEIRTPMTAILGYADVLLAHIEDPDNQQCVHTIKRNGNFLLEIINDILDLSKIEAGKLEVETVPVSPDKLVAEVISLMHVRAEEKELPLFVEYEGLVPRVIDTDPTRLRQVLVNLVGNAIKFTRDGRVRVCIAFESDGEPHMSFEIEDTGIGMSDDQQQGLFEPFNQADTSHTRKYGGTGLGLTICERLVDAMGGKIAVTSTPGEGSTFKVTIPVSPDNAAELMEPRQGITAPGSAQIEASPRLDVHVLVVDDRHDIRYLSKFFIENAGGTVETADNGGEAIAKVRRAAREGTPFDILVMDMQMPVMDGYETARRLRHQGFDGPIVALTAAAMNGDRERCLSAGCDSYITKPIDGAQLIELVSTHARKTATADADVPATAMAADGPYDDGVNGRHERSDEAENARPIDGDLDLLLVDDNRDTCEALGRLFELKGVTARWCHNGKSAIEAIESCTPDAVLLDIGLGDMSGYDVLDHVKDIDGIDDTVFIALSGRGDAEDVERSQQAGFAHHVVKPATPEDLLELIRPTD